MERWRWNKPRQKKTLNTRTVMILQKRKQVLSNSENKGRKTNIDHTEGQDSLPILKKYFSCIFLPIVLKNQEGDDKVLKQMSND